jgi:nicotinamide riboside transporter PnuC
MHDLLQNPDFLAHIGYATITGGTLLLALRSIWGWFFRFVGDVIWLYVGWQLLNMPSVCIWMPVFMLMEIVGFLKWRKNRAEVCSRLRFWQWASGRLK